MPGPRGSVGAGGPRGPPGDAGRAGEPGLTGARVSISLRIEISLLGVFHIYIPIVLITNAHSQ